MAIPGGRTQFTFNIPRASLVNSEPVHDKQGEVVGRHARPQSVPVVAHPSDRQDPELFKQVFQLLEQGAAERWPAGHSELELRLNLMADAFVDARSAERLWLILDSHPDFVREMPLHTFVSLGRLIEADNKSLVLGPTLSAGGNELVQRVKSLGVKSIELFAPCQQGDSIHFSDVSDAAQSDDWTPHLKIFLGSSAASRADSPAVLRHVFVPQGSFVESRGFKGQGVQVHFTDRKGKVVRTEELGDSLDGYAPCSDVPRFVMNDAPKQNALFDKLSKCVSGRALDLSHVSDEMAAEVVALTQPEWDAWLRRPEAVDLTTLVVGDNLKDTDIQVGNLRRVTVIAVSRSRAASDAVEDEEAVTQAFCNAVRPHLPPGAPPSSVLKLLLKLIKGTELDLSSFKDDWRGDVFRSIPAEAWNIFLDHPKARHLESVLMSAEFLKRGPLPLNLDQFMAIPVDSSAQAKPETA